VNRSSRNEARSRGNCNLSQLAVAFGIIKTTPMTGGEQEPDYGAPKRSRRIDRLLALLIFALILLVLVRVFFR
jgi:hypothetical protein